MTDSSGRVDGARDEHIAKKTAQDNKVGICRFCVIAEGGDEEHPSLLETDHWYVTENISPMPGADQMLLVISKTHGLFLEHISMPARQQLLTVAMSAARGQGIDSFMLLARLGRPEFNAMTQYHIHFQINSSDRLPAEFDMLPLGHQSLIEDLLERLPPHPKGPMEALAEIMTSIDVYRAATEGKAVPLRYKGSNKVDPDRLP